MAPEYAVGTFPVRNVSRHRWLALVVLWSLLTGCDRVTSLIDNVDVPREPVEECQAYERLFSTCFHRATEFASQSSLIPKTRGERAQIRANCSANLERLRQSCR